MARIINFYEVSPEEKNKIAEWYESSTAVMQVPDYPDWKKGIIAELLPMAPEMYQGHLFDQYMNRTKFKIRANGGKIQCDIYEKPCDISAGVRSHFKGYIILRNVSNTDFYVDKYTELGLLFYGYCGFTHLMPTIGHGV
jgi:hypothetical protein